MTATKIALAIMVLCTSLCSSCSRVKPWVKPYERQNIADPIMNFSRDPIADEYLSHVHDAREGAKGADGGSGGGCGCN
jgi:hypothetical protein